MGTKIVDLYQATTLQPTDVFPISQDVQGGAGTRETKKATINQLASYLGSNSNNGLTIDPSQIRQGGAADNAVLTYSTSTNTWVPKGGTGSPTWTPVGLKINPDQINSGGAANDAVLTYSATASAWVPKGGTGSPTWTPVGLKLDVNQLNQNGALDNYILKYSTGSNQWVPSEFKVNANQINQSGATNGSVLTYSTATNTWVPQGGGTTGAVNTAQGIKLENGIAVNLDPAGGLMFNSNGQVKIAPVASVSNSVVVRPSDPGATDAYITRTSVNGEMRPYFKTLSMAANWSRDNITGNYNIYVDEDTIEGLDGHYIDGAGMARPANVYVLYWTQETNMVCMYVNQAEINRVFGSGSGMAAGVYVWPKTPGQKMEGGVTFGAHNGNGNRGATAAIMARYQRIWGWDTDRYFDEPPRKINYNIYFTNNINLQWNGVTDDAKWGTSGTRQQNWVSRIPNDSNHGTCFIRNMGCTFLNSKMYVRNMMFKILTNTNDTTCSDMINSDVRFSNVTLAALGTGYYMYAILRAHTNSTIHICGENLKSRVTDQRTYPGYALSIIGNAVGDTSLYNATYTPIIIYTENSILHQVDYDPFGPNGSKLLNSIILDGDFLCQNNFFAYLAPTSMYDSNYGSFIVNNFKLRGERFDTSGGLSNEQATNVHPTSTFSVFPFGIANGVYVNYYSGQNLGRMWTIDRSSTESNKYWPTLPMLLGTTPAVSFGSITSTEFAWNRSTSSTQGFTSNIAENIHREDVANLPQVTTYYRFTEAGNTYTLNYGR